ncbi:copper transporter [Corynebacterium gerontici]|uniref:Copper transporter MctB n=1 Tax=Corynebacterium gerontici TaxID=2079234 RepID=A0A3G6J312_9CORY|nr:copper transporter [Corynebacterium gerontici]AZA11358.1 Copper transporter MctB precursor [Corynebacterium gerontici]
MAKSSKRTAAVVAGVGLGAALGIAAGALVLAPNLPGDQGPAAGGLVAARDNAEQEAEVANAQAQTADEFIKAVAPQAVEGQLQDKPILILRAPGSSNEDYEQVKSLLKTSGAIDSGTIELEDSFFDQNGADGLKSVVTNSLPAGAQLSEDKLDAGTHAGEALAAALFLDKDGKEKATTADRAVILKALRQDKYIDYPDNTILPAQGVVLLLDNSDNGDNAFRSQAEANFASALREKGGPVVVAGGVYTAVDGATIDLLRSDSQDEVSTVDSIERAWAQVAAILALKEQFDSAQGDYGAADSAEAASPSPAGAQAASEEASSEAKKTDTTTASAQPET